jgi:glycosyltransferase involved in cell wall biosynthesis
VRLAALVERLNHVCCRFRVSAFRTALESAGHSLDILPLPRRPWDWLRLTRSLAAADVVILQRKLLPAWQLYLLRRAARQLIFDFDDAVFLRDSYALRGFHSARRRRRFAAIVAAADRIVAGNAFLREQASRATSLDRVHIIPTCIDPAAYQVAEHRNKKLGIQLIWLGSSSTLRGLERAAPLLETLGEKCPGLRLKLVCDRFLTLDRLAVETCPWSERTEREALASADVGIGWVPDDLWSRGKCGLKILQYMAAGLPVVANPVGVHTEMVRPGITGFLATSSSQWVDAVRRLAASADLRGELGEAGRQRISSRYSVAHGAGLWLNLLDELGRRRQSA